MLSRIGFFFFFLHFTFSSVAQWQGFEHHQTFPLPHTAYNVRVVKDQGDDHVHVVLLSNQHPDRIYFFKADQDGLITAKDSVSKDSNYRVLEPADIDRDGRTDLLLSGYWNNGFTILWSEPDGKFTQAPHYAVTGHGKSVVAADIDKDGATDIISLSGGSGQPITLHIFRRGQARELSLNGVYSSMLHTDRDITILDKNKDGLLDVMVSSSFPWFVIFYQTTSGDFVPRYWPHHVEPPFKNNYSLVDLNNDTREDVVVVVPDGGGLQTFEGKTDTLFSETFHHTPLSFEPFRMHFADLNHDGFMDVVADDFLANLEGSKTIYYLLGNGDLTFQAPVAITFPAPPVHMAVTDINNDGFDDIVAYCQNLGVVSIINLGIVTATDDPIKSVSVTPNPFHERITINSPGKFHFVLSDINGKIVHRGNGEDSATFDLASLPQGLYLAGIQTAKSVVWRRLVKSVL